MGSQIQEYFAGKTVFLTGGTGFLGKLVLEKLLRTCHEVKKIWLLVRDKRGMRPDERLSELFNEPVFGPLKTQRPNFLEKVSIFIGDCELPDLGLNTEDMAALRNDVDVIIHCAASVNFDEALRKAAHINVRALQDLLNIAKGMAHLSSFVYISTAYSNCIVDDVDEEFYKAPIMGQNLLHLVNALEEDVLSEIKTTIVGKWPNTYVFTKAVAEDVVKTQGRNLPVSILRPSMIIACAAEPVPGWAGNSEGVIRPTWHRLRSASDYYNKRIGKNCEKDLRILGSLMEGRRIETGRFLPVSILRPSMIIACAAEPVPGWADNSFGITRVLMQTFLGIVRTFRCDPAKTADLVPADYVANAILAVAWETAQTRTTDKVPVIYNYVSGSQNPITWAEYGSLSKKHAHKLATALSYWHFLFLQIPHEFLYLLTELLLHTVPAYVVDFLLWCFGRKPMYVTAYKKLAKFCERTSYFSLRDWNFTNRNTQNLWKRMNDEDRRRFEFDIGLIDWDEYFSVYMKGIRVYNLRDPLDTLPQGQKKALGFKIAHYTIVSLMLCMISGLLYKIASVLQSTVNDR